MSRATAALVMGLALPGLTATAASAQDRQAAAPEGLDEVGVTEHLDDQVPLSLRFTDEAGEEVRLGDYFHPGRPVILNLGYYACPMLCGLVLNGLLDGLRVLDWTPGREFEMITVSIDTREGPRLAIACRRSPGDGKLPAAATAPTPAG